MNKKLKKYREKIDIVDDKIVKLLIGRFKLVEKTINYKMKNGLSKIDLKRDAEIIKRAIKKSGKKYSKKTAKIFEEILKNSK